MWKGIRFLVLLLAVGAAGVIVGRSIAPPKPPPTRAQAEADAGLDRVIADVDFRATPLEDAIDYLRQQTDVNVSVRWREMEAAGIDRKSPITLRVTRLPLGRVLELVCDEAGGGKVMLDSRGRGGVVLVSTAEDNARHTELRLYDVRDLIEASYDHDVRQGWRPTTNPSAAGGGGKFIGWPGNSPVDPRAQAIDDLVRIITEFVAPDMWRDAGGTVGSMRQLNGRLLITGTPDMHDQVRELLEQIREGK